MIKYYLWKFLLRINTKYGIKLGKIYYDINKDPIDFKDQFYYPNLAIKLLIKMIKYKKITWIFKPEHPKHIIYKDIKDKCLKLVVVENNNKYNIWKKRN